MATASTSVLDIQQIQQIVPKLQGPSNYDIWADSLEVALRAKGQIYW